MIHSIFRAQIEALSFAQVYSLVQGLCVPDCTRQELIDCLFDELSRRNQRNQERTTAMTDTSASPETIDLDVMIDQGYDEFLKKTTAQELEREQQARVRRDQAQKEFEDGLIGELGLDLVQALGAGLDVNEHQETVEVTGRFAYLGEPFTISRSRTYNRSGGIVWQFNWTLKPYALHPKPVAAWLRAFDPVSANDGEFRAALLAGLGMARAMRADYEALEIERQQKAEAQRVQWETEQARRREEEAERERQEAEAAASFAAEQARLQDLVDVSLDSAAGIAWRWPEGVTVTIYRVRWLKAAGLDADGNPITAWGDGWTTEDRLDGDGYVYLRETSTYGKTAPRAIKLSLEYHLPTWEPFTYADIESLPANLRAPQTVVIPGITREFLHDCDAGMAWVEDPERSFTAELPLAAPVAWVRERIDQQAGR